MKGAAPTLELRHPALEPAGGEDLESARLTDRQRVSILLQAAALLSHLDFGGWRLPHDWAGAMVDGTGRLRSIRAEAGRDGTAATDPDAGSGAGSLPGRGDHLRSWSGAPRRASAAGGLGADPDPRHRRQHGGAGARQRLLLVGPGLWRGPSRARWRACGQGDPCSSGWRGAVASGGGCWRPPTTSRSSRPSLPVSWPDGFWDPVSAGEDPVALARKGRWRVGGDPLAARSASQNSAEKIELARALFALARFEEARAELRGLRSAAARVLRAWCHSKLGEIKAAERIVHGSWRRRQLEPRGAVGGGRAGGPHLRQPGGGGSAPPAGSSGCSPAADLELIACAVGCSLLPRPGIARIWRPWAKHLEDARAALERPHLAWRWYHAKGLEALHRNDGARGHCQSRACAMRENRRQLRPFEASTLWNDLAYGRALADDLAGAEKAFRHSHRLLGDWQGPRKKDPGALQPGRDPAASGSSGRGPSHCPRADH